MQLIIDNFDTLGPTDYSGYLDAERMPQVARVLNRPSKMEAGLVSVGGAMVMPHQGSRIWLQKTNGTVLFAGYVTQQPVCAYAGKTTNGAVMRVWLQCASDEWLLDRRALPQRMPYVGRTAGAIMKQMTADVTGSVFDVSAVQNCDVVPVYNANVEDAWSAHAAELAMRSRAVYRAENGAIAFAPVGGSALTVDETSAQCNRAKLSVEGQPGALNDVTLIGQYEPRTYVKDYFEGDALTLSFSLADSPLGTIDHTVFEDEFPGPGLNPVLWTNGTGSTASVSGGQLNANGKAVVQLAEQVEMAGGIVLQHGCFEFQAACTGVLGGLYAGTLVDANCVAGFRVRPSGGQSVIQALVNGGVTGPTITTVAGHQYQLTTRVFADQSRRMAQMFHSSQHPAGAALGGEAIAADARVVLEVHDVDPANPATMAAASTVLYDDVLTNVAGFCNYLLMNGTGLHCNVSYARMRRNGGAVVRSAPAGGSFRTRLQGALADGGECRVTPTDLYFVAAECPALAEQIVVSYRTGQTAKAEQSDAAAIAQLANTMDDGVRSGVRGLQVPEARSTQDCTNGAAALLEDSAKTAWAGSYETWNDFLGAEDVCPGDAVAVHAPSQAAQLTATVREVGLSVKDLRDERSWYALKFANDAALPLGFSFDSAKLSLPPVGATVPGNWTLAPVKNAEFTEILASQVTIATHLAPPSGGGFEVRGADVGWGPANDRNLWGRFTAQSFDIPRLSRSQSYYVRQYDAAGNYSRDSMLLRVDWPL